MTVVLTANNGKLTPTVLVECDTGPNGPQSLRFDAAWVWEVMHAWGMPEGCLRSGYRTLAQQADEVRRAANGETPSALPAGQSFHGEGVAADADEPARTWLHQNGPAFGVILNTVRNEPWHVIIDASKNTRTFPQLPPLTTKEDDDVNPFIIVDKSTGRGAIVFPTTNAWAWVTDGATDLNAVTGLVSLGYKVATVSGGTFGGLTPANMRIGV